MWCWQHVFDFETSRFKICYWNMFCECVIAIKIFFWTKILKNFNEFLSRNYANAMIICVWCFFEKIFSFFYFWNFENFWYWFFWFFEILRTKRHQIILFIVLILFQCIENQRIEKKTIVIRSRYRNVNFWIRVCVTHVWH